jgi:hypothetical protein
VPRVQIRVNARVYQDFQFSHWPMVAGRINADPETEFEAQRNGQDWKCVAKGYGASGDYGSGAVYVLDMDGVIEIDKTKENIIPKESIILKGNTMMHMTQHDEYNELARKLYAHLLNCTPEQIVEAAKELNLSDDDEYWDIGELDRVLNLKDLKITMTFQNCVIDDLAIGYMVVFEYKGKTYIADQNASPFMFWMKE